MAQQKLDAAEAAMQKWMRDHARQEPSNQTFAYKEFKDVRATLARKDKLYYDLVNLSQQQAQDRCRRRGMMRFSFTVKSNTISASVVGGSTIAPVGMVW